MTDSGPSQRLTRRFEMPIKPAAELVAAANAVVDGMTADEAQTLVGDPSVRFVDVREPAEWAQGHLPGAVHAPRGLLEFHADPASPMFMPDLADKRLVIYCASGGRSALAGKTLKDMGYADVANLEGGFSAWAKAGRPTET